MTAAMSKTAASLSVPLTQNTAPVLEYECLYTHDSRKKTKKWQDGFLRYHTFNKRVMVYDMPRNLIGDMHWTRAEAIQAGDELSLERNGVMVEVAEQIGQTETDLTALRNSKNRTTPKVQDSDHDGARRATAQTPRVQPAGPAARSGTQLKHKSLNALLGTPRGPIGIAQLPSRSPFEERYAPIEHEDWTDGRPPKRPRFDTAPARNVTRTTITPRSAEQTGTPLWACTADARKQKKEKMEKKKKKASVAAGQQRMGTKEAINLSDDPPHSNEPLSALSDDLYAQSSPRTKRRPITSSNALGRSSSPASQVQRPKPKSVQEAMEPEPQGLEEEVVQPANPRKLAACKPDRQQRQRKDESGLHIGAKQPPMKEMLVHDASSTTQGSTSSKLGQALRLVSAGRKKRTLLCQDQLTRNPKRLSSTNTDDVGDSSLVQARDDAEEERPLTAREKVEARLARIEKRKKSVEGPLPTKRASVVESRDSPLNLDPDPNDDLPDGPPMGVFGQDSPSGGASTSHDASVIESARLDRLVLPRAAPPLKPGPQPQPRAVESVPVLPPPTLRRAVSDVASVQPSISERLPAAPLRYTLSPPKSSHKSAPESGLGGGQVEPIADTQQKPVNAACVLPGKLVHKKKGPLQKSVSLNITPSNGTSAVMLSKPFQRPGKAGAQRKAPEEPEDLGPWSREAFDLFGWRPPGWNEEKWCMGEGTSGSASSTIISTPPGLRGGASLPMFGRPVV